MVSGLCIRCGAATGDVSSRCQRCLEKARDDERRRRLEKKLTKTCKDCRKEKLYAQDGKARFGNNKYCARCVAENKNLSWYWKKKHENQL